MIPEDIAEVVTHPWFDRMENNSVDDGGEWLIRFWSIHTGYKTIVRNGREFAIRTALRWLRTAQDKYEPAEIESLGW